MRTIHLVLDDRDYYVTRTMAAFSNREAALAFDARYGGFWSSVEDLVVYDTLDEFQADQQAEREK